MRAGVQADLNVHPGTRAANAAAYAGRIISASQGLVLSVVRSMICMRAVIRSMHRGI